MLYKLITYLLWPALFIYTIKIALRDKSLIYFYQRLGFSYPQFKQKTFWIHCASVGEVNTYLALHQALLSALPDRQFIISTNTTTGARSVLRHKLERTHHCFLPIESSFAIQRFIEHCNPAQCLIMETEIWPLLYRHCHASAIAITLINARLSHKTLGANAWVKDLYKTSLQQVDKILCKSEDELQHYKLLGAHASQLSLGGNLKFTTAHNHQDIQGINLQQRSYCLAASTHDDEELQLARLWQKLNCNLLLVIAPRHPVRSQQIQKQLNKLQIKYAVRSKSQPIESNTKIYLADTLGELASFIQSAEFVFMGGSLIKHGGQNILEAARLGKITLCGPHMFNFKDETQLLLSHQACIQVDSITELQRLISELIAQPDKFKHIGKNAYRILSRQTKVLDQYVDSILQGLARS